MIFPHLIYHNLILRVQIMQTLVNKIKKIRTPQSNKNKNPIQEKILKRKYNL